MKTHILSLILLGLLLIQNDIEAVETWVQYSNRVSADDIEVSSDGKIWLVVNHSIVQWDTSDPLRLKFVGLSNHKNKIIANKVTKQLRAVVNNKLVTLNPERLNFLNGFVSKIALDKDDNLWAVTLNNDVYRREDGIWQRMTGSLSDIAIGVNGETWGLAGKALKNGEYRVMKLKAGNWQAMGNSAQSGELAVDETGTAWIIKRTLPKRDKKIFRYLNNSWVEMPGINRPVGIVADQKGKIRVMGRLKKRRIYTPWFKWEGKSWLPTTFAHMNFPVAFSPKGNPISPGIFNIDDKVPEFTNKNGVNFTADLGVINFTIDKNDKIWAIRDHVPRNLTPEILLWENGKFKTAIETKKLWEYSNNELKNYDQVSDIAIEASGIPYIISSLKIFYRKNNQWVKADQRSFIDIISSPKGEIWALGTAKSFKPDPYKKSYPFGVKVFHKQNGTFIQVGNSDFAIYKIAIDKNDKPWILALDRDFKDRRFAVYRLEKNLWEKVPFPEQYKATIEFGNGVDGSLWLGVKERAGRFLLKWNGTSWEKYMKFPFMASQVNSDSSGKPMGIYRGGFMRFNVKKSELKTTKKKSSKIKSVKDKPKQKIAVIPKIRPQTAKASLVGCWKWSNGANIIIKNNGTVNNAAIKAKWQYKNEITAKSKDRGIYIITWPSIFDLIKLLDNGASFSGINSFGIPISGKRISGNNSQLIGKWKWFNGIDVIVDKDKTVKAGALQGNWKVEKDGFLVEWPIVDTIMVSPKGDELQGKNQFGNFSAVRSKGCK